MPDHSKNLKDSINTLLDQLTKNIPNYSEMNQVILTDFVSLLHSYIKADNQREVLSKEFEKYINENLSSNKYLQTPFLWFTTDFIINANLILSMDKFHSKDFFQYLITFLRRVFQLIRVRTPLSDINTFESLQYKCNKLQSPISYEQLKILEILYLNISKIGFLALKSQRIKSTIKKYNKPKNSKFNLDNFFKLLDIKFFFLFNQRMFDLERLYVHFKLDESKNLEEIIDFQNSSNSVLCRSGLFTVKGKSNSYIGLMTISTQYCNELEDYLQKCVQQKKLILYDMVRITSMQRLSTLSLYQVNKGWNDLSPTMWRNLIDRLSIQQPRNPRVNFRPFFKTPAFKPIWHYQLHEQPQNLINLYCKLPREYTINNLPLDPINDESNFQLSQEERENLKTLYLNQAFHIGVRSDKLWYEWALDAYWIKSPQIPFKQLLRFLYWLPVSELYFSEYHIYIYARLPHHWALQIKNELGWEVWPVIRHFYPHTFQYEWYDPEQKQWNYPLVLKKN